MIVHLSLEKTSKDIDVSSILKTDLLIGYIIKSLDKIYVYCFGEVWFVLYQKGIAKTRQYLF